MHWRAGLMCSCLRLMNAGARSYSASCAHLSRARRAATRSTSAYRAGIRTRCIPSAPFPDRGGGGLDGFPDQLDREQRRQLRVEVPDRPSSAPMPRTKRSSTHSPSTGGPPTPGWPRAAACPSRPWQGVGSCAEPGALGSDVDIAPEQLGYPAGRLVSRGNAVAGTDGWGAAGCPQRRQSLSRLRRISQQDRRDRCRDYG